ncbi:MAG: hypothetical protein AB7H80_08360 [Candidatus Kapaibacterium sp.]
MKQIILCGMAISLLLISSCKDAPNEPTPQERYANSSGQPLPDISDIDNIGGVLGTYLIKQNFGISIEQAFAQFGTTGLDAGEVSLNGYPLTQQLVNGSVIYSSSGSSTPTIDIPGVVFDGSDHEFTVVGSSDVPAVTVSVPGANDFLLLKPLLASQINRADGLDIQWTGGSASSDERMLISISSTASNQTTTFISKDVPNSGSYSFSTADLGNISGTVVLNVAKYRMGTVDVSGKTYVALSEVIFARAISIVQ